MPSLVSTLMREQIRLTKPLLSSLSIKADRAAQDALGELEARVLSGKVDTRPESFENFEAEFITPREFSGDGAILYLHGGGYVSGSLKYARGFGSLLAAQAGLPTLCPAYRLAPENPFPAALDDALQACLRLYEKCAPEKIVFAGESAGGGLVFCLGHLLKERGLPLPGGMVAISPWSDLTLSGRSCRENERLDPSLTLRQLAAYAQHYAVGRLEDPLVSPLFGDFSGFPPALLVAGSDELLRDDAVRLYNKYRACGAECCLKVEEGMWHVYPLFATPEARAALELMYSFVREALS